MVDLIYICSECGERKEHRGLADDEAPVRYSWICSPCMNKSIVELTIVDDDDGMPF